LSKNFGWGSRDMQDAGRIALESTNSSFSTISSHAGRFGQFKDFAKSEGVARMERVDAALVEKFGQQLAAKVDADQMKASYAQNLISSINAVMSAATRGEWRSVSPTKDCNIAARCNVRDTPSVPRVDTAKISLTERQTAIVNLAQDFGLRSKEASLLNAKKAYFQAIERGTVSVCDGTKGGRSREVPINSERQIETLRIAANSQGEARAVMPENESWKEWREGGLRETREAAAELSSARGLHDLRASYACERYEALTGHPAPCNGWKIEDREADRDARMKIAKELGHNRIEVVASYIGSKA